MLLHLPQRGEPVVCGRRICKGCKHWRHLCDFAYRKSGEHVWILKLCWSCQRAKQRGYYYADRRTHIERATRWKQRNPEKVAGYHAKDARKRKERERRYYQDPENRARRREYNRQWYERKRRRLGVPKRSLKSSVRRAFLAEQERNGEREPKLDPRPFQRWVAERLPSYNNSVPQLADMCQISERQLRTYIAGRYKKKGKWYKVKKIGLSMVDHCIQNEGFNVLWEVYPDLYEDESLLDAA